MTKKEMIDKIYEVIADKTLSFWCMISVNLWWENKHFNTVIIDTEYRDNCILYKTRHPLFELREWDNQIINWDVKIIWHPVMIGDVLDYLLKKWVFHLCDHWNLIKFDWFKPLFDCWCKRYQSVSDFFVENYWEHRRKPIEDQSVDCIEYIYNLSIS